MGFGQSVRACKRTHKINLAISHPLLLYEATFLLQCQRRLPVRKLVCGCRDGPWAIAPRLLPLSEMSWRHVCASRKSNLFGCASHHHAPLQTWRVCRWAQFTLVMDATSALSQEQRIDEAVSLKMPTPRLRKIDGSW